MIIGLKSVSVFGKKQCQLVGGYKLKYIEKKDINPTSKLQCCHEKETVPSGCDIALKIPDLVNVYNDCGFKAAEIDDLNQLHNFHFIKHGLKFFDSPIVLNINKAGNAHMNLITGFGEIDGCQYILLTDPLKNVGERYIEFKTFIRSYQIDNAWVTELKFKNLKKDAKLDLSLEYVEKFIKTYYSQIQDYSKQHALNPKRLLNKWTYLASKDVVFVANTIHEISNEVGVLNMNKLSELLSYLSKNHNPNDALTCYSYLSKDLVDLRDVNYIDEQDLIDGVRTKNPHVIERIEKGNAFTVIGDYATKIEIKIEHGKILVKPIQYPRNYSFSTSWQTYSDFLSSLIKEPKVEYFQIDDTSPIRGQELLIY
ncbi:MAG: hypothetical protein Tsb0033_14790 [Winogradskyella sp.]